MQYYPLYAIFISFIAIASDTHNYFATNAPSIFPDNQEIGDISTTYLPQSSMYFTTRSSQETIIIGPCSPCVGIQICSVNTDECLYVHQHTINSPEHLKQKITKYFIRSHNDNLTVDITLFTCTHENEFPNSLFAEGTHKQRIIHLVDIITSINSFLVRNKIIYYHKPNSTEMKDRFIIFKKNIIHRLDIQKQRLHKDYLHFKLNYRQYLYEEKHLKKKFGDRLYDIHPQTIWLSRTVPLYRIKKPNLTEIASLPISTENPLNKYFTKSQAEGDLKKFIISIQTIITVVRNAPYISIGRLPYGSSIDYEQKYIHDLFATQKNCCYRNNCSRIFLSN